MSFLANPQIMQALPFILIVVVMYFLMIRPQMRRQKEHRSMLAAMTKGDEVVVSSGILGKITKVSDDYVEVEIATGTEITVQKSSVSTILPKGTIKSV